MKCKIYLAKFSQKIATKYVYGERSLAIFSIDARLLHLLDFTLQQHASLNVMCNTNNLHVHFNRLIRGIVLRTGTLMDLWPHLLWLASFTVIGLLVAAKRFKKRLD